MIKLLVTVLAAVLLVQAATAAAPLQVTKGCKAWTYAQGLLEGLGLSPSNKRHDTIISGFLTHLVDAAKWHKTNWKGPINATAWQAVIDKWCISKKAAAAEFPLKLRLCNRTAAPGNHTARRFDLSYGDVTVWGALAAYAIPAGSTVHDQVIDFTNIDTTWATSAAKWGAAQKESSWKVAGRNVSSNSAWVYPAASLSGSTSKMTVALLADWGTAGVQAVTLLSQVMSLQPDLVSHLGDVYYMGESSEQTNAIYNPIKQYVSSKGVPFYNIPGNHDYYSGGQPFYDTVDKMRNDKMTPQQGSYFALETDNWTLLHLDTGRPTWPLFGDASTAATYLDTIQLNWALAQVAKSKAAGKKIILLSHHQLFTLADTAGSVNGTAQVVNPNLYSQLKSIIPDLTAWFWGHEHTFMVFQEYMGLKRGRLIGGTAIPQIPSQNLYTANTALALPAGVSSRPQMLAAAPQSSLTSFKFTGFPGFYQPSFAMLNLAGATATVDYYQADWNCWSDLSFDKRRGTCEYYTPVKIWSETF